MRQGGGGGHQDPEMRGPFGPQFALKIRGASPRSATKYGFSEEKKTISLSQCSPWPTKVVQYFGLIVLNIELMFESF